MLDFGDSVRIKASPETEALGIACRSGIFYGFTTPSVSGIVVVGSKTEDLAYSISIEEMNQRFWLAPDLVEFEDHGAGTEIRLDGVRKTWRREANGSWTEHPDSPTTSGAPIAKKPWWRFW